MKKLIVSLTTLALAASQFLNAGSVVYAEEEASVIVSDSAEQPDLIAAEGSDEECLEGELSEAEYAVDEDIVEVDLHSDTEDFQEDSSEIFDDDAQDAYYKEGVDSVGLIEDVDELFEAASDDGMDEMLMAASDEGPISADGQDIEIPLNSSSMLDYTLTTGSAGEYHFIGTNVNEFQIFDKNTEDEMVSSSDSIPDQTGVWFCSVSLKANTEYIVRVKHDQNTSGSFYCYKLPEYCVLILDNSYPTGSDIEDVNLKKRIYYGDANTYFDTELLDEWNYCVSDRIYFKMSILDKLTEVVNGSTSSVVFADPDYGHSWDGGTVTKPADCGSAGIREYHCVCGQKTRKETIAKTNAHTWSNYNSSGIRTCSVCGTTQYDASEVVKPAPVYEISGNPMKVKLKAAGGRKLTVSWKLPIKAKLKKIKGYYIEVATDSAFTNIVKTRKVGKKKTTFTFKKLNKKQRYFVRVRFYKGTQISKWSAVKSKKVK